MVDNANQTYEQTRTWIEHARAGQQHFETHLDRLTDADFDGPTDLEGWTRRHLVAHVGYNAAALRRLADWAHTGVETPMYDSTDARGAEIEQGSTLPVAELRELVPAKAVDLFAGWDALAEQEWYNPILTAQGRTVEVNDTPWMRNREVWVHAVDLDNGATFSEIPGEVLSRMLPEIYAAWQARGTVGDLALRIEGHGAADLGPVEDAHATVVSGPLAGLTRWATGRGIEPGAPVTATRGGRQVDLPTPPRWL